jgi:biotin operon repressor
MKMNAHDENILNLKAEGKSLREIASALGISHEAVRKRPENLEGGQKQVSTFTNNGKLTVSTSGNGEVSTCAKPYESRVFEKLEDAVNPVSTKKTPSLSPTTGVNPSGNHSRGPLLGMKGVYQGVDSESGDLFEGIKVFLEAKGVEVYRINVKPEGYQVKNNGQTIRIYVQRDKEETG